MGNTTFDSQGSPTQKWGIRLGTHSYTEWVTSTVYALNAYVFYGNNVYTATSAGTSGATPPTHTSGSVSDGGVTWKYIYTTATSFHPTGNQVGFNVAHGNLTADYSDAATLGTNTSRVLGNLDVAGKLSAGTPQDRRAIDAARKEDVSLS
jgi:hypothetical protein